MRFLEDYQELVKTSPMILRMGRRSEKVDYTDRIYRSRQVYFSFDGGNHLSCAYLYNCWKCTDCVDLSYSRECELCWESSDCLKCYGSSYLDNCQNLTECHFCSHCRASSNLFGCFGLHLKKHCIFNRQYSKKDYQQKLVELRKQSASEHLTKLKELIKHFPARGSHQVHTENCDFGDYVVRSNNCYWCFDTIESRDSAYLTWSQFCTDCFDCFDIYRSELLWECRNLGHSYNCSFVNSSDHLQDCHFCTCCYRSKHLFGCVNLYQAKYCILNQQYSKKDYLEKIQEIKKELDWLV
ncbi:hypothetical protein KKD62_03330 [Patescibacteria group bacterium]|nr:hypothetical protein [Patescibacteria group bacterium]MBU1931319.1 hypothetical protein [Patescibacteria group bacterium]